jgi:signal transduction histidine kinase
MVMLDAPGQATLCAEVSKEEMRLLAELSSREIALGKDELLSVKGDLTENFYLLVEGALLITRRLDGREKVVSTDSSEQQDGCSATRQQGDRNDEPESPESTEDCRQDTIRSLLLATPYMASARALRPSRLLEVSADRYLEWVSGISPANSVIVPILVQRVKTAETLLMQREKMAALGKMAAGLTHELNNPASAASRAASQMSEAMSEVDAAISGLIRQSLTPQQMDSLVQLRAEALEQAADWARRPKHHVDPIEQSELEDEISDWMDRRALGDGWKLAPTLAEVRLGTSWLDSLADSVPGPALRDALGWAAGTLAMSRLLGEIDGSTARISDLVAAVKAYSHMDRAPEQAVDIHEGIESTLTILSHKLRGIDLARDYARNLPRIRAYPGELNQVWTNLLDNAADALNGQGRITVRTWQEDSAVMVEVADNGPGIPPQIQPRIFEPFFTTKPASKGMGLGLDISYRIVAGRHHGDIRVESSPGDTRFQVCLPIGGPSGE